MAITASVEKKSEQALVAALKLHADLAALDASSDFIRRYSDRSKTRAFPCVLVRCAETVTPTLDDQGHYIALMEIQCHTLKKDDANADLVNDAVAAVRDAFTAAGFVTNLESVGGIDVVLARKPASTSQDLRRRDDGKYHVRTLLREIVLELVNI